MSQHELFGHDLFGEPVRQLGGPLARQFVWPPFTLLNSQTGAWQERKRAWLALGIQSELGRGAYLMADSKSSVYNGNSEWSGQRGGHRALSPGGSPRPATDYSNRERGDGRGRPLREFAELVSNTVSSASAMAAAGGFEGGAAGTSGTSVFDPVLCELAYRWFAPAGGSVLDPFAGGSVRGIVAAALGLRYVGLDLAAPQLAANREQMRAICHPSWPEPWWAEGDSRELDGDLLGGPFDFVFSCPPYGDLEVYSDDPRDLSTMDYRDFLGGMAAVLERCAGAVGEDRFLAFVVGDFRAPDGTLRGFPGDLIALAARAGLAYYNDAILVTAVGSLPVRVAFAWERGRKLGRTHQHLFVFCKGDGKRAAAAVTASWGAAPTEGP